MTVDLRRAPLVAVRGVDLRAPERDLWADETAIHDRLIATWPGLDEAAWRLPGAAPSDAGGPDWSLAEHVGHLVDWQELAIDYTRRALDTGTWPRDEDYAGGDFDRFNEARRDPWRTIARDELLGRFAASRPRLLALAADIGAETIRTDAVWSWIYLTLHGHYLDHLGIIEAWTSSLLQRQADGDPFVEDPRPVDHAAFVAADAVIEADLDAVLRTIPPDRWDGDPLTPGWSLRDHVGHLADWGDEGARVIEAHRPGQEWPADPDEGVDAWNERMVLAHRDESSGETIDRWGEARDRLRGSVARLSLDDLRSPDGWSWAYDCLYGHVRKHLAVIGPWAARLGWPAA